MPQPWKHPKSGVYYFRKVVPEKLRSAVGRREIRISLRTKDLRQAKLAYPDAALRADALLQQAAGGPIRLTHKEVIGLAGEWCRRELHRWENDPGDPEVWDIEQEQLIGLRDDCLTEEYRKFEHYRQRPEPRRKYRSLEFLDAVAKDVQQVITREGLVIDDDSRQRLAERLFEEKAWLHGELARRARGEYHPDEHLKGLPPWERPTDQRRKPALDITLTSLLDLWAKERPRRERTLYEWRRVVKRLVEHLGHDDPERVAKKDIVAWKDALIASGMAAKTVKNHVDIVRTLYASALDNERLERKDNPARGVKVAARDDAATRRQPYADDEAVKILRAARQEKGAMRWLPWLLAFTGARLDELCQALKSDIRREADTGIWYLDINAEKGKKLKNVGSARKVPLHEVLRQEGFLNYVDALPAESPLFPDLKPDRFGSRGGTATKRLGRWTRQKVGITDRRKAPAHSWRHRFKTICRAARIPKDAHDALTGHAPGDVGGEYGEYPLAALGEAIEQIPIPAGLDDPVEASRDRAA